MRNKDRCRQSKYVTYIDSKGKMIVTTRRKVKPKEDKKEVRKVDNNALIENYKDLVHVSKEAEAKHNSLKNNLMLLHKKKEQLEWSLSNKSKKLKIKKCKLQSKEEITDQLKKKLDALKEKTRMTKFEYDQLINETNKQQQILNKDAQLKTSIQQEMDEWVQKKESFLDEITHERTEIYLNKKNRKEQLNKLLIIIKKEVNIIHNVNYLKMVQNTLNSEINNFKTYKQDEANLAMNLLNLN